MRNMFVVMGFCGVVAGGCSSEELRPLSKGRQIFEQDIMPILNGSCVDCHANPNDDQGAPDFLTTVDGQYYESLVAKPEFVGCDVGNSLLLLKVKKGLYSDHPGGALTDPQYAKMSEWLSEEAKERFQGQCGDGEVISGVGGSGGAPVEPLTGEKAIAQFGACMTITDWKESGMPLVGELQALEGDTARPCYSCHESGDGANWMADPNGGDADIQYAFDRMRVPNSIYHLVVYTVNNGNPPSFKDIVQSNHWRDKGTKPNHPTYILSVQYQGIIDAWFKRTYDKWKSGSCAP